jgi:ATP-dependent DNA helicase Rep
VRLIETGLPAAQIAARTFTRKAAVEMLERAKKSMGSAAKEMRICTLLTASRRC